MRAAFLIVENTKSSTYLIKLVDEAINGWYYHQIIMG